VELHADGEPWLEAGRAGESVRENGDAPRQNNKEGDAAGDRGEA
jgi:hypothetical protein